MFPTLEPDFPGLYYIFVELPRNEFLILVDFYGKKMCIRLGHARAREDL